MAAINRASTPKAEPFPSINAAPHTPTSLPTTSHPSYTRELDSQRFQKSPATDALRTPFSRASLSPKISRQGLSPRASPQPLTGAAAMADVRRRRQQKAQEEARQTSPNPAATALSALMGSTGMSKANNAPSTSQMSEPMQRVAEKMTVPASSASPAQQTLPINVTHFGTSGRDDGAMTITAPGDGNAPTFVDEPGSMTPETRQTGADEGEHTPEDENENSRQAFTYPGPMPVSYSEEGPSRGMSLPDTGYDQSPKSSSAKRHKCPYCSTDFTRHHNLKSHLLTHSQEKPYVCQTCQARFRRLHDLKRHSKLHTGERPHTCPKCGRRFARGDALARHNKGPGGCAGRRSSINGEDDGGEGGDDTMDGLEYQDEQGDEERTMLDENGRRISEPSRKRAHLETPHDSGREVYRQHSSTYPPPLGRSLREHVGNMGPPQAILPSSSVAGSPEQAGNAPPSGGSSYSSQYYAPPPAPIYTSMVESPKPLSPGQADPHRLSVSDTSGMRNRSPSLTQQFQQQHFGRNTRPHVPSHPPQLPSLSNIAPGHTSTNRHSVQQGTPLAGPSLLHHQQHAPTAPLPGSNPSSMSSHGHSSGGSMRDIVGQDPQDMWNYIRNLEARFSRMQDEYELRIGRLQEEMITLKGQVYQQRR